jgi:dATP pyrophosphohydrolase
MRLPIQVQAILFRKIHGETQYLLLKRIPGRGGVEEGFWQPVTGGLEEGETRIDALKREVHEETGIQNILRIIPDVHYYEFQDFYKPKARQRLIKEHVFGVEVTPNAKIIIGWEHSEHRWCQFEAALKLLKWMENKEALAKLNNILSAEQ